jgi:hypothetical protein
MERRIALRKNDEWMNKFIDRSCSKFRMRETIGNKNIDISKLRNGI